MSQCWTETVVQTLSLESQASDPFVVLKAIGDLDLQTQDDFEQAVSLLLGTSPVVVDLSQVEFLAISALRSLIVCHRLSRSLGQQLFFAEPSRQILRLLAVSGLDAVLPLAPTVAQVVSTSPVTGSLANQTGRDLAQLDVG